MIRRTLIVVLEIISFLCIILGIFATGGVDSGVVDIKEGMTTTFTCITVFIICCISIKILLDIEMNKNTWYEIQKKHR